MQDVFRAIGRLSQSNVTVMITGESGTGKELVARALHKHSPRANGPFIALNTAAIPKDLLESELFGHERGAFTGAQTMRRGRFEQAEGGTLFLDEIGDMPFDLQTRLLRVLSDGNFYRVGGHNPLRANVRVIAATHQNLETRQGRAVPRGLVPPPQRDPPAPAAAARAAGGHHAAGPPFPAEEREGAGVEPKRMSDDALAYVSTLPFPGNVRQLENLCNWLTVMAPAQTIEVKDLPREMIEVGYGESSVSPMRSSGESRSSGEHEAADVSDYGTHATGEGDTMVATRPPMASSATSSASAFAASAVSASWETLLAGEAKSMLESGQPEVMDALTRRFEKAVLEAALGVTRGRRVEAATRLGIGRNTITRKLQELGFD
jgi:two-component system nitrogen regulation response regulator GlnG